MNCQQAHRLTGFSSMDTHYARLEAHLQMLGAPPDGFLIDGHKIQLGTLRRSASAHRLTGFSSMDTNPTMLDLQQSSRRTA